MGWGLLAVSLVLLAYACRVLALDAREGPYVTMGGQMYYAQLWALGALAGAGAAALLGHAWWWFPIVLVPVFLLRGPMAVLIVGIFLGTGVKQVAEKQPQGGFAQMSQKADDKRED